MKKILLFAVLIAALSIVACENRGNNPDDKLNKDYVPAVTNTDDLRKDLDTTESTAPAEHHNPAHTDTMEVHKSTH